MKTVFLHIGLHKTGTTAVQYFFAKNAEAIAKAGYYYPASARPKQAKISYGHHMLAWSLFRDRNFLTEWPKLINEFQIHEQEKIVISSEEFDVLTLDQIMQIREYLAEYDVKVIVYLRRQDEFAQAYYTTDVVFNKENRDIEQYILSMRTRLDYHALISDWASLFGKENINVRVYERSSLVGGDIVADFCSQIGLPLKDDYIRPPRDINKGYPRNIVELIRSMKRLMMPQDMIYSVIDIAGRIYTQHKGYDILSPLKAKELMQRYSETNAKVSQEYLGQTFLFKDSQSSPVSAEEWSNVYAQRFGNLYKTIKDLKTFMDRISAE